MDHLGNDAVSMPPAIVLVGGLGTRLRGVVDDVPKPLAPVAGRPFLEFVLDRLVAHGIERAVLATGFRGEQIEAHFGSNHGALALEFSREDEPLGTGGAILRALRRIDVDEALVLNGDTLFEVDLTALVAAHRAAGADLTLALRPLDDVGRFGAVRIDADGRVVEFVEKSAAAGPGLVNGGVYVLRRAALEDLDLPERFGFERDVLEDRVGTLHLHGVVDDGAFVDIGVPEDYARAQRDLAGRG